MVKPPTPQNSGQSNTGGLEIAAALLCIAGLIIAAVFAKPKEEPQTWPRTGQWECTR